MTNPFEELLHQLGKVFNLALHIDRFHACSIQLHEQFTIQLQLDGSQEQLWLFSKLIEIPPGKFRENIFREALKANGLPDPRPGTFGYLAASNHLALFQKYPLEVLNGENLSGILGAFVELGESWIKAIANGQAAPPSRGPTPFGLK